MIALNYNQRRYGKAALTRPITANKAAQAAIPTLGVSGQTTYMQTQGQGASGLQRGPVTGYVQIQIANATPRVQQVAILDPIGGLLALNGIGVPAGVTITGLTTNFNIWVNALAGNVGYQISNGRINVVAGDNTQIGNPLDLFYVGPEANTASKVDTVFPDKFFNEYQQLANVQTFEFSFFLNNLRALAQQVQANTTYNLAFDVSAVAGRTL